jgi:hypothetical protein
MHAQSRKKKPKAVIPVPLKQQVGAGDVVKKITSALGIPTCGPCEARRRRLNQLVAFGRRRG